MNQKEFDASWNTIRGALSTCRMAARVSLQKLEAECRIDRSLLEVRTVIDHHVAEEKQTAHFEYAARRLRMWLEFARDNGDLLLQLTPGEREWLAVDVKRTDGVVTPLPVTTNPPPVCNCADFNSTPCPIHGFDR